jgi:hypothetical protein
MSASQTTKGSPRIAALAEGAALLAIMRLTLHPLLPLYFWALAGLLIVWFPWRKAYSGTMSKRLRLGVLGLACSQTVFGIMSLGAIGNSQTEVVLACWTVLAWFAAFLAVSNSAVVSMPLGMIGTLCTAIGVVTETPARVTVAAAAVALVIAVTVQFFDSKGRPYVAGGWLRRRFWSASGHVVVIALCAGLALFTYDWALDQVGALSGIIPDSGGSKKSTVELDGTPPQFRGSEICAVHTSSGPLPRYLAERVFHTYHHGRWLGGRSAWSGGPTYGLTGRNAKQAKGRAHCYVSMMHRKTWPLVPFGARRANHQPTMTDPPLPFDTAISESYSWGKWSARGEQAVDVVKEIQDLDHLRKLARSIMTGADDDLTKVRHVESWLRRNTLYDASLAFSTREGHDAVENFLLGSRRGWCVHYASAAALLLRAEGVPTRFVTGYMVVAPGGADTVTVVDSTAHAWCEALVSGPDGPQWMIVDASYAPVPQSTFQSAKWRHAIGITLVALILLGMLHARLIVNAGDLRRELAMSEEDRSTAASIEAAYHRILRFFERLGVHRLPAQTPREFAQNLSLPLYRDDFLIITAAFERVKYMGYRDLGTELEQVDKAQRRILGMEKRARRSS